MISTIENRYQIVAGKIGAELIKCRVEGFFSCVKVELKGNSSRALLGEYLVRTGDSVCFIDPEKHNVFECDNLMWPNLFEIGERKCTTVINNPDCLGNDFHGEDFRSYLSFGYQVVFLVEDASTFSFYGDDGLLCSC